MSDVCKQWYNQYKKRYDKNIELWNTDKEKCALEITGHNLNHNAWRMMQISGAVDRMGGFANFKHYVNKCAEEDYLSFENLEKQIKEMQEVIDELHHYVKILAGLKGTHPEMEDSFDIYPSAIKCLDKEIIKKYVNKME